jgi:hypothetical protein
MVPRVNIIKPNTETIFVKRMQFSRVIGILKKRSQYQGQYLSLFLSYIFSAQPRQIDIEKNTEMINQKEIKRTLSSSIVLI